MAIESVVFSLVTALGGSTASVLFEAIKELIKKKADQDQIDRLKEGDAVLVTSTDAENLRLVLHSLEEQRGVQEAVDSTSSAIAVALKTTQSLREDRRKQATWSFAAALALSIIGVLVIFVGVGLLISGGNVVGGAITTGAGIVSEVFSALLFKLHKDTNDRFDAVLRDAQILESTQIGIETAAKIENRELRDRTLSELATRINSADHSP